MLSLVQGDVVGRGVVGILVSSAVERVPVPWKPEPGVEEFGRGMMNSFARVYRWRTSG